MYATDIRYPFRRHVLSQTIKLGWVLASGGRPARAHKPAERDRSSAARQYNYYRYVRMHGVRVANKTRIMIIIKYIYIYNNIWCTILYVYRTPIFKHVSFLRVQHTSTNIMACVFINSRAIGQDPVARVARAKQWPLARASNSAAASFSTC